MSAAHVNAAEITIWTDAERLPLVRSVLDLMGAAVRPIGVGGARGPALDQLANDLGCPALDDLRQLLVDHPAAFVLLAAPVGRAALDEALAAGSVVLTLDPVFADLDDLAQIDRPPRFEGQAGRLLRVPAFTAGLGWRGAVDPAHTVGSPYLLRFDAAGAPGNASLHARLDDGWRTLLTCAAALPQTIDAALAPGQGGLAVVPADLRALTGSLSAHARFLEGDRRFAAALQVSDQVALERAQLHIIGAAGAVRVGDTDYELHDADGRQTDHAPPARAATPADLLVQQWRRLLDQPPTGAADPFDRDLERRTLACCLACLLSARTGQPESPAKFLALHPRRP